MTRSLGIIVFFTAVALVAIVLHKEAEAERFGSDCFWLISETDYAYGTCKIECEKRFDGEEAQQCISALRDETIRFKRKFS